MPWSDNKIQQIWMLIKQRKKPKSKSRNKFDIKVESQIKIKWKGKHSNWVEQNEEVNKWKQWCEN